MRADRAPGAAPIAGQKGEEFAFVLLRSANQACQFRNARVFWPARGGFASSRRCLQLYELLQRRHQLLSQWIAGIQDSKPSCRRDRLDDTAEGTKLQHV